MIRLRYAEERLLLQEAIYAVLGQWVGPCLFGHPPILYVYLVGPERILCWIIGSEQGKCPEDMFDMWRRATDQLLEPVHSARTGVH